MNWLFHIPERVASAKERGRAAVGGVRAAASHAVDHAQSLAELLRLELQEYGAAQTRRLAVVSVAVVLLLTAYLSLCVCLSVWLSGWMGWMGSVACIGALNLAGGIVLLLLARALSPGSVAPLTRQELKSDLECLKLLMKENE